MRAESLDELPATRKVPLPQADQNPVTTRRAGPARRHLCDQPGLLPLLSLGVLAVLVAAGNTPTMLTVLGILGGAVLLNNLAPAPALDPVELSSTVLLGIVTAVPFGALPHDRTTSVVSVGVLLSVGVSALVRAPLREPTRGRWLALALFGLLAFASVLSPDAGAIKALVAVAAAALPAFFLGARLDPARLRTVSRVVVTLALAEALLAMAEPFVFPGHLWPRAALGDSGSQRLLSNPLHTAYARSEGTFVQPLLLGLILVIGLGLLLRVLDDLKVQARVAGTLILLGGLAFSGDRSCLIGAFLLLIAGRRVTVGRTLAWLGGAVTALVLLIDIGTVSSTLVTNFTSSGSYLHRVSAYSLIWRLFSTQSLAAAFGGNGFGSTQRLFDNGLLQTDGFQVVDNQFVLTQAQGGVLCLLLLVALAGLSLAHARRELRTVIVAVVVISVIFDWLSSSDSALGFLLLGAGLATCRPLAAAQQPTAARPAVDLSRSLRPTASIEG